MLSDSDDAAAAAPAAAAAAAAAPPEAPPKRKRGRPPKARPAAAVAADDPPPVKRGRGRPPGSKNKSKPPSASMAAHVLQVEGGQDVCERLRQLCGSLRHSLVLLAATGALSAATLVQLGAGGERVAITLQGHLSILSLSGALLQAPLSDAEAGAPPPPSSSRRSRPPREPTCSFLSASLANPSGGVVGGAVGGPLLAAGRVVLVVGLWDPGRAGAQGADAAALPALALPAAAGGGLLAAGSGGAAAGGID